MMTSIIRYFVFFLKVALGNFVISSSWSRNPESTYINCKFCSKEHAFKIMLEQVEICISNKFYLR